MNILYIHGFGSSYDPEHEKIKALETLGTVSGVNVDYCAGFTAVYERALAAVMDNDINLVVGTSMGGYLAAHVASKAGVPFVSLNPVIVPSITLQKWVGNFVDFKGNEHSLSKRTATSYPDIATEGAGLVVVETADEVLSASDTVDALDKVFNVHVMVGGSHRFTHINEALPLIKNHYEMASITLGSEETNDT